MSLHRQAARKGISEAIDALIEQGKIDGEALPSVKNAHPAKREIVEYDRMAAALRQVAGLDPIDLRAGAIAQAGVTNEVWTRTGDKDEDTRRKRLAEYRLEAARRGDPSLAAAHIDDEPEDDREDAPGTAYVVVDGEPEDGEDEDENDEAASELLHGESSDQPDEDTGPTVDGAPVEQEKPKDTGSKPKPRGYRSGARS